MTLNISFTKHKPSYTIRPITTPSPDDATFGDRIERQLTTLEGEERATALRQYLVQPSRPIIYDAAVHWTHINTAFVSKMFAQGQQDHTHTCTADDEVAKQLLTEAAQIYYSSNRFVVRLHLLYDFLYNSIGPVGIHESALVRDITVIITADLRKKTEKECQTMAMQLRYLSSCINAEKLVIEIAGGGDIAGIDWPTQETIRTIAPVLKDLISQFGDRLSVSNVSSNGKANNITSYWSKPIPFAKSKLRKCKAVFDQIITSS
ncbi:hypothetical protein V8C42DRAFT_338620 [Trichoderma barbatum]